MESEVEQGKARARTAMAMMSQGRGTGYSLLGRLQDDIYVEPLEVGGRFVIPLDSVIRVLLEFTLEEDTYLELKNGNDSN
jgi:hypothetical protein